MTIKAKPARIVSLAPTATEDLYAVGAGPQVVAVDQDSDYPATAPVTKLSGLTPNLEAIAKYNPDLVISSQNSGGLVSGLDQARHPGADRARRRHPDRRLRRRSTRSARPRVTWRRPRRPWPR